MKHTNYYGIKPLSAQEQNAKVYLAKKVMEYNVDTSIEQY